MKSILILIGILFFSAMAMSAVPRCWQDESKYDIEDGVFSLTLATNEMTKEQILSVLEKSSGKNIRPRDFPSIYRSKPPSMTITITAVDDGVGEFKLSHAQLKDAVSKELAAIITIPGVTAKCAPTTFLQ